MSDQRRGVLAGLAAYGLFGLFPLYWKLIEVPADQIVLWRMVGGFVVVTIILGLAENKPIWRLLADRRVALVHLLAASLLTVNWLVFIYAVNSGRVVEASLGYFINPLLSVLLGVVALGERLSRARSVAVGLAAVGVAILTVEAGHLPWISLLLAFSFALYGLVRKRSPRGSLDGLATELMWMAPPAGLGLVLLGTRGELVFGDRTSAVALSFTGVVTVAPLLLLSVAWRSLPLSLVGLMQYIVPVMQFSLGVFVFGERVSTGKWTAVALMCTALALLATDSQTRARSRKPNPRRVFAGRATVESKGR